jgi:hypothetical protein
MEPLRKHFLFGLVCLALIFSGCSDDGGEQDECTTHADCPIGEFCFKGSCFKNLEPRDEPDGGEPDGGEPDGGDPGGGDDGGGGTDLGPLWTITPGVGIGPLTVSLTWQNYTTLAQVKAILGDSGQPVGSAKYTLSFMDDKLLVAGIDINANQQFDDADHIIAITVREGIYAETDEGLGVGSPLSDVRQVARFTTPDRSVVLPPYGAYLGGKMEEYFTLGIFFGYDDIDQVASVMVTRPYPQPPDATLNPAAGTLQFGGGTIYCGNGYDVGSTADVHRGILGQADWFNNFNADITLASGDVINVRFYLDSYRILGMEFLGGDDSYLWYDIDRLIVVMLYPLFYGRTAAGNGLGSTKAEWEAELGAAVSVKQDPQYEGTLHVYQPSAEHYFAITFSNDGASQDDVAVFMVLNYQEN